MAGALCYGARGGGAQVAFHVQAGNYDTDTLIGVLGELRRFRWPEGHPVWDGLPAAQHRHGYLAEHPTRLAGNRAAAGLRARPQPGRRRTQGGQLMRGAVYKRGSTWTWHFDIDPDPLTGRRRQRTKGGYKTKKAAEQALAEAIGQWRPVGSPSAPPTLSHFLQEEWLPAVKPRLAPLTWANFTAPTSPPTSCRFSARSSCRYSLTSSTTCMPICWSVAAARRSTAAEPGWRQRRFATCT